MGLPTKKQQKVIVQHQLNQILDKLSNEGYNGDIQGYEQRVRGAITELRILIKELGTL